MRNALSELGAILLMVALCAGVLAGGTAVIARGHVLEAAAVGAVCGLLLVRQAKRLSAANPRPPPPQSTAGSSAGRPDVRT